MILVRVRSGLGNQLFQYAFYRELEYRGREVCLLTSWFDMEDCPRTFMLDKFDIKYNLFKPDGIKHCCYTLREDGVFFDPCVFAMDATYMDGYWQSEYYFEHVKEDVRSIRLKKEYMSDERYLRYLTEIQNREAVFVHVRRGDYVTNSDSIVVENWNICDVDYYYRAIEKIKTLVDNPFFCFFSNDMQWVKTELINQLEVTEESVLYIEGTNEDEAYIDLALMCDCKHAILSNSSMSWWGSYMGVSKGIQIAPRIWSRDLLHQEIYRKEWIIV